MTKVFILFTGEYTMRSVHSVHSTLDHAKAVDALVRKGWSDASNAPDIEEQEIDPALCADCGYDEELHSKLDHPFVSQTRERQIDAIMPLFRVTEWRTDRRGLWATTTMDRDRTRASAAKDLTGSTVALSVLPGVGGESGLYKVKAIEMFCIERQREGIGVALLVEKVDGERA